MTAIIFDIVVGVIVLISTLIATLRGFVREVLTILGLIGATAVTWIFGGVMSGFYTGHMTRWAEGRLEEIPEGGVTHMPLFSGRLELPIDFFSQVASYSTVFFLSFSIVAAINFYVAGLVQESKLSIVDRSLGAAFGLARGVLLATLLYIPIALFVADEEEKPVWIAEAQTAPLLQYGVDIIQTHFMPEKDEDEKDGKSRDKTANAAEKIISNMKDAALEAGGGVNTDDILFGAGGKKDKNTPKDDGYDGDDRGELDQLIEQELDQGGMNP
ncbi:MAG: CvpA family protein [Pseudomonadota bacterium]|nr:CvpA family protein [Pseudomonadota bacterium]QKK04356.1 MAG: CvpA family protein [Pseudomonadota bacterium]